MSVAHLGVVIVTYNAADVILDCLETLLNSAQADYVPLRVVVIDNASTDGTRKLIKQWAAGEILYTPSADLPFACKAIAKPLTLGSSLDPLSITLLAQPANGGFAAGVNVGLAYLAKDHQLDRFWVLNPDSVLPLGTVAAFAEYDVGAGGFSLMGGRVVYLDDPGKIQTDGGLIDRRTGVTHGKNKYAPIDTAFPDPMELDFISGANMVVSRAFYEAAGPMREDYFLYYEEVDWALQRNDLPLAYCAGGIVYHRAGTAIGSPALNRPASPFSLYFKHRARLRFMRRFFPARLPVAFAYSLAKAAQLFLKGYVREAWALLLGSLNRPPPAHVLRMLSDDAVCLAFPEHTAK